MAGWHEWQVSAQGARCRRGDTLWWWSGVGHGPYLSAVALSGTVSERELETMLRERGAGPAWVWDPWQEIDLAGEGFTADPAEDIYACAPTERRAVLPPPELSIVEVSTPEQLEEFERASVLGFEHDLPASRPRWHVESTLGLNGRYFGGLVDDRVVSVSIACASDGVVGVYGVATLPAFRRRGYGAALTAAAMAASPGLPAVLEPSDQGAGMYRSLGFKKAGAFVRWHRPAL